MEDLMLVALVEFDSTRIVQVGFHLNEDDHMHLTLSLQANMDVITQLASDMPSIDLDVIVHLLNIDLEHWPVRQKKKSFVLEHQKIIKEEIDKLLKVGFVQEVNYYEKLVNIMLVKKCHFLLGVCMQNFKNQNFHYIMKNQIKLFNLAHARSNLIIPMNLVHMQNNKVNLKFKKSEINRIRNPYLMRLILLDQFQI